MGLEMSQLLQHLVQFFFSSFTEVRILDSPYLLSFKDFWLTPFVLSFYVVWFPFFTPLYL